MQRPNKDLARKICTLLQKENASHEDGVVAVTMVLITALIDRGFDRKQAFEMFGEVWDAMAPDIRRIFDKQLWSKH